METSPISAMVSSNGGWPPAPAGYAWIKPSDWIQRTDVHVRCGDFCLVSARDVGCTAGNPVVFADGGFSHYARPVTELKPDRPNEALTAGQKKRLLSRADDIYFLLDLADAHGFISGTTLQRRFREHRRFILNGKK